MRNVAVFAFVFSMFVSLAFADHSISGRVVDADGVARSSVNLSLYVVSLCDSPVIASIRSDSEGRFQWAGTLPTDTRMLALRPLSAGRNSPVLPGAAEVTLIPVGGDDEPINDIEIRARQCVTVSASVPATGLNVLVLNAENNTSAFVKPDDARDVTINNVRVVNDNAWIKIVANSDKSIVKYVPVTLAREGRELPAGVNVGSVTLDHMERHIGGDVSILIAGADPQTDLRSSCPKAGVYLIKSDMSTIVLADQDGAGQHLWTTNVEPGLYYVYVGDWRSTEWIGALIREAGDAVTIPQDVPRVVVNGGAGEVGVGVVQIEIEPLNVRSAWLNLLIDIRRSQLSVP